MHLVRLRCWYCMKEMKLPKTAADAMLKRGRVLCAYCQGIPAAQGSQAAVVPAVPSPPDRPGKRSPH